ncbi:DNA methyltransferase [Endothiovibrio diazotrophicus]
MAKILKYQKRRTSPMLVEDTARPLISLHLGDSLENYEKWPSPTAIVSDGPYGLAKFPGEPNGVDSLAEWYAPHIAEWSKKSTAETTLWFWCSELAWAEVHQVLKLHGWKYKAAHIWDKGIGHVAGNCNGDTIRGFPVVTEICVQYVREIQLRDIEGKPCSIKEWLRSEWLRSGLPLYKTNEACGVKNAATRKYFTQCHLWYFPPPEKMEILANYANKYGQSTNKPYFSLDDTSPLTAIKWSRMRAKWNHTHGITNVWQEPAVRGKERIIKKGMKSLHANQKPLTLMDRIISASTDPGDIVWEPFGGLCSASVASLKLGRACYASEVIPEYFDAASERIKETYKELPYYERKRNT